MPRIAIAFALLMLAAPAAAQDGGKSIYAWDRNSGCARNDDPQVALDACGALIAAPGESRDIRGQAYGLRGLAHYQKKEYDLAIADFTAALRLKPDSAGALFGRAFSYKLSGKPDLAAPDFERALAVNPNFVSPYIYADQPGRGAGDGELEDTFRDPPVTVYALVYRGATYKSRRHYALALADYNAALRLDPQSGDIYWHRAELYDDMGRPDLAILDYTAALADPKPENMLLSHRYVALWERGRDYEHRGDDDSALADYSAAIDFLTAPDAVSSDYLLAKIYDTAGAILWKRDRRVLAMEFYDKAVAVSYDFGAPFYVRGRAHLQLGHADAALADYAQARLLTQETQDGDNAEFADALLARAFDQMAQHRYDLALADLTEAIRLKPALVQAFVMRGDIYAAKSAPEKALLDYKRALELKPGDPAVAEKRDRMQRMLDAPVLG